jgi:putative heme-binding domain-containing protein
LYEHLARFIPDKDMEKVISSAKLNSGNDVDAQFLSFKGIQQGIARRGGRESGSMRAWGAVLAKDLLQKYPPKGATSSDVKPKQQFAADLVGRYKISSLENELEAFLKPGNSFDTDVRAAALRSLLTLDVNKYAPFAGRILNDTVKTQFKRRVATLLGDFSGPAVNKILASVEKPTPDLQNDIVMALSGTSEGKNIIFRKVRNGEILPRTLIDPKVEERLLMNMSANQRKEFEVITASLEPVSKERQIKIDTWVVTYNTLTEAPSIDSGKLVFTKNCSPCHAIQNNGGAIGPQLDGVGKWGPRALTEKILDPNRNVSESFRNYTITLKDGKVMTGLFRREEGEVIVFADVTGKEFSVPKNQIVEQKPSKYTLMPDHFGEVLSQDEFNALLRFLLSMQS